MSKKNSSVILKEGFKGFGDLSKTYFEFKKKFNHLKQNNYVVAVSGGPDSLALAALTRALSFERKIKFYYVLVNHNLRKDSSKEAILVKKLLKKNFFNLNILNNRSKISKNIQSQARLIRYKMLSNFCEKKGIKTIVTAHNLEDQVETFFIRLSRGSGLTGLSGMKTLSSLKKNIKLFRPLLDVRKKILIKISKNIFGKFFNDPTNKNLKYLRSKIRNLEKPLENSGINYNQIIRSIKNLASSKQTLDEYYKKILKDLLKNSKKQVFINWRKFKDYNQEIKIRVINDSIKKLRNNYYNPRSKKVLNLIKNLENKEFKQLTLGGCVFIKKRDKLCLKLEKN